MGPIRPILHSSAVVGARGGSHNLSNPLVDFWGIPALQLPRLKVCHNYPKDLHLLAFSSSFALVLQFFHHLIFTGLPLLCILVVSYQTLLEMFYCESSGPKLEPNLEPVSL